MLSVHNSRRLGVLADLHAQRACQPTNSSVVPETVLVQSLDITRWLSCCLADCPDGDVHVHFPFSATCIWELFEHVRLNVPETSLFSSDVLTWRAGLNRLLVGDVLRGGNTRVFVEISPDDAVETGKARVLGWLHTFTEAAFGLIAPPRDRRPVNAWLNTGAVLNERFFAPDAREDPDVQAIQQALPHIGHDAAHASFAGPVSLDMLTPGLRHSLAASTERIRQVSVHRCAQKSCQWLTEAETRSDLERLTVYTTRDFAHADRGDLESCVVLCLQAYRFATGWTPMVAGMVEWVLAKPLDTVGGLCLRASVRVWSQP